MSQINLRLRDGSLHTVEGRDGTSIMEVIRGAGFDELMAMCGGACSCATCHVYVGEGFLEALPALGADEDDLLDSSDHRQANSRLACQVLLAPALDGLDVVIAPED